jgi:hypothetical protein
MAKTPTTTDADRSPAEQIRDRLLNKAGGLTAAERERLATANATISRTA